MTTNNAESWVLLRMTYQGAVLYKVMSGWKGGYLSGDSWKINSGITGFMETDREYRFDGYSGSQYFCPKDAYRMNGIMSSVFANWMAQLEGVEDGKMELVAEQELSAVLKFIKENSPNLQQLE